MKFSYQIMTSYADLGCHSIQQLLLLLLTIIKSHMITMQLGNGPTVLKCSQTPLG